jgi:signal transduction histidine kinase
LAPKDKLAAKHQQYRRQNTEEAAPQGFLRISLSDAGFSPDTIRSDRSGRVVFRLRETGRICSKTGQSLESMSVRAQVTRNAKIEIVVEDTDVGMPRQELVKAFDRFHKVERGDAVDSSARGSGLGLAISKEIVQHY